MSEPIDRGPELGFTLPLRIDHWLGDVSVYDADDRIVFDVADKATGVDAIAHRCNNYLPMCDRAERAEADAAEWEDVARIRGRIIQDQVEEANGLRRRVHELEREAKRAAWLRVFDGIGKMLFGGKR